MLAQETSAGLLQDVFQPITFTLPLVNKEQTFFQIKYYITTPAPGISLEFGFSLSGIFRVDVDFGIDFVNLLVSARLEPWFGVKAAAFAGLNAFAIVSGGLELSFTVLGLGLPITGNVMLEPPTLAPKACLLSEMELTPLSLSLDFYWEMVLCPKIHFCKGWLGIHWPCGLKIVGCGKKYANIYKWSADTITQTIFEVCWTEPVIDTTPPYGGAVSIGQEESELVVNFNGVTDDESKLMSTQITLLEHPSGRLLHEVTVDGTDTVYKVPSNVVADEIPQGTALIARATFSNTAKLEHTLSSDKNAFGEFDENNLVYFDTQKPQVTMFDTTPFGGRKHLPDQNNLVFSASNEFNLGFEVSHGIWARFAFVIILLVTIWRMLPI